MTKAPKFRINFGSVVCWLVLTCGIWKFGGAHSGRLLDLNIEGLAYSEGRKRATETLLPFQSNFSVSLNNKGQSTPALLNPVLPLPEGAVVMEMSETDQIVPLPPIASNEPHEAHPIASSDEPVCVESNSTATEVISTQTEPKTEILENQTSEAIFKPETIDHNVLPSESHPNINLETDFTRNAGIGADSSEQKTEEEKVIENPSDSDSSDDSSSDSDSSSSSSSSDFYESLMKRGKGEETKKSNAFDVEADDDNEVVDIKRSLVDMDDGDLDGDIGGSVGPMRTKNEVDFVEKFDFPLSVPPETPITLLGTILHIVNDTVVVKSTTKRKALDLDSLLALEDFRVLGRVFETFGPVDDPLYSVKFTTKLPNPTNPSQGKKKGKKANKTIATAPDAPNPILQTSTDTSDSMDKLLPIEAEEKVEEGEPKHEEVIQNENPVDSSEVVVRPPSPTKMDSVSVVEEKKAVEAESKAKREREMQFCENRRQLLSSLSLGMPIFSVVELSQEVVDSKVWVKGYDASDMNDEELAPDDQEFSDDEAERLHAAKQKEKRKRNREERMRANAKAEEGEESGIASGELAAPSAKRQSPYPGNSSQRNASSQANHSSKTHEKRDNRVENSAAPTDFLQALQPHHPMNPAYRAPTAMIQPVYPGYAPMGMTGNGFPFPHPQAAFMAPPNYPMPYGGWPYMMPGMPHGGEAQPQAMAPNFVLPGSFAPPPMNMPFAPYPMPAPHPSSSDPTDGRSLKIKAPRNSDHQS